MAEYVQATILALAGLRRWSIETRSHVEISHRFFSIRMDIATICRQTCVESCNWLFRSRTKTIWFLAEYSPVRWVCQCIIFTAFLTRESD